MTLLAIALLAKHKAHKRHKDDERERRGIRHTL